MITKFGDVDESLGLPIRGLAFHKFGRNPASESNVEEVVWTRGGTSYPWPTQALETTVKSTDANDKLHGTGCQKLKVFGLDAELNAIEEEVELNGTGFVTLENEFYRVYRAYNSGDTDAIGHIYVQHGSTVLAEVVSGRNQTEMAVYTVPKGETLYITSALFAAEGNKEVSFSLWAREPNGVFRIQQSFAAYGQGAPIPYNPALEFSEGTDIYVSGKNKGNNDIVVAELYGALLP